MLKILLSRTDKIGDVILTLPMAGILKSINPKIKIFFLGNSYTKDIINCSQYVDTFIDWDKLKSSTNPILELQKYEIDAIIHVFPNKYFAKLSKEAGIQIRIGTNRRWFHFLYCNQLINLSRKKSLLHESILNIKLLHGLKKFDDLKNSNNFKKIFDIQKSDIHKYYGFNKIQPLSMNHPVKKLIQPQKFNLIIHPKSGGSAQEWSTENIVKLVNLLPTNQFNVFFTGSQSEYLAIKNINLPNMQNIAGTMTLIEFIAFIQECDGLIAASTGPLHIAAALKKYAIGLYPSKHTMSLGRWGALGTKALNFEITTISPQDIYTALINLIKTKPLDPK